VDIKKSIGTDTVMVGDFNTPFSTIDRLIIQPKKSMK
jgi:hypothetical protein